MSAAKAIAFLGGLRDDVAHVEAGNTNSDCLGTLRVNRDLARKYRDFLSTAADRQEADTLISRAGTLLGE